MDPLGLVKKVHKLISVGTALSAERDRNKLLEIILLGARELTNADGGTLYTVTSEKRLKFEIVTTESLNLHLGGTSLRPVTFREIPIYQEDGTPNEEMVVACAAVNKKTINIADAYSAEEFDFSGTQAFDKETGYHSKSFLAVPMLNHEGEVIGVLQLINATSPLTKEIVPFSSQDQDLVESLASQAAVCASNQQLINSLNAMLEGFIRSIADAIDAKSPYTANHCHQVPIIAQMLAEAVNSVRHGPFKNFRFTDEELYELRIAALLHDCGKVTTPVHVIDKATRLETICDRMDLIETRFQSLRQETYANYLEKRLKAGDAEQEALEKDYQETNAKQIEDLEFIKECNDHHTFIDEEKKARIAEVAKWQWTDATGELAPILTEDEVNNLYIVKGTLNDDERQVINDHVVATIKMLEHLPYPKHLRHVPEIAGRHHEHVDGKGYPTGCTGDEMSVQAKILAIADVFEALSSKDRPYKKAFSLSKVLDIIKDMSETGHIDPELYDVFMNQKVYLRYAKQYLALEQIDVNEGYVPGKDF